MKKILTLGEILLRLSPPNYQTLTQAQSLECQFGGSELNVISTLAQLGYSVSILTALPDNDVGRMADQFLFTRQIDQTHIVKKGRRLGTYYLQKGFSLRPSRVTYDREYSSFAESRLGDYDLEAAFKEVAWFHVSGITAALTEEVYRLTKVCMAYAKEHGIPVSFDLNYRETLWNSFQEAREKLSELLHLADVCIGLEPISLPTDTGKDLKDELHLTRPYRNRALLLKVVQEIAQTYGLKTIAFTQREMGHTNEYGLKAYLYQDTQLYETEEEAIQVLDRVGTGDAYTAGLIYGLLEEQIPEQILKVAMASFKFKHTIEGDINLMSRHDIEQMLEEDSHEIKR